MRFLTAIAALAALLVAVSCEGGSNATAPRTCSGLRRPGVPLAYAPAKAPTPERARCIGLQYAAVIGRRSLGHAAAHHAHERARAWPPGRSGRCSMPATLAAWPGSAWTGCAPITPTGSCTRCRAPRCTRSGIRTGCCSTSPTRRTSRRGAVHVRKSLAAGGWTGVEVIDAGNDPDWSDVPIDPSTGQPMTEPQRRQYLADALTLVRATLKIEVYSVLASNGPPSIVNFHQINSTDAVTVGAGLRPPDRCGVDDRARTTTGRSTSGESGTYVGDRGPPLACPAAVWPGELPAGRDPARLGVHRPCGARPARCMHSIPGRLRTPRPRPSGRCGCGRIPNAVVAVNPCGCRRHRRDGCRRAGHDGPRVSGDRDRRPPDHDRMKPFVYYRPTQGMVPAAPRCM